MKPVSLLVSLLMIALPVQAQIDKEWKNQEAGLSECRTRYKKAQYQKEYKRYYVDSNSNVFSLVWFLGEHGSCIQREYAQLNTESRGSTKVLLKIEGNNLVRYSKKPCCEVEREVLAERIIK